MSIELLQFGNVTVFALALSLAAAGLVLLNQIVLWVGRIALSLDAEGAPKVLGSNWLLGKLISLVPVKSNLRKVPDGWGLTSGWGICGREYYSKRKGDSCTWRVEGGSLRDYATFPTKEEALASSNYKDLWLEELDVMKYFACLLLADLAILWLQHHFLSAAWALSVAGIVLTLRFITGKLWGHNKRITALEEKKAGRFIIYS